MSTSRSRFSALALPLAIATATTALGCGGPQRPVQHAMRPLEEARAVEVVLEAFRQVGVQPELHRTIHLANNKSMEIDVATAGKDHGVEYVSTQDRIDFGDELPHRRNPDALLTCVGVGTDAQVDVLILDDQDFLYEPDHSLAGPGHPTNTEVEDRLRQNVVDYLTYLQQHGQL